MATPEQIETAAWHCSEWPQWLHDIVDHANEVADRADMSTEQVIAYAVLTERDRATRVANERAAQLFAGINNFAMSEETRAGWAGQMMEALMIEQRIFDGHQPVDSIDTSLLKNMANQPGDHT